MDPLLNPQLYLPFDPLLDLILDPLLGPIEIHRKYATRGYWGIKCHPEVIGASKAWRSQKAGASKGPIASSCQKSGESGVPLLDPFLDPLSNLDPILDPLLDPILEPLLNYFLFAYF